MKLERWFNLMVGQVEPKNDSEEEVNRQIWNSAKKWLTIANEFFVLNNIELNLNMPATAEDEPPFVPTKELLRCALEICEDDPVLTSYILVAKECAMSEIDLLEHNVNRDYHDARLKRKYDSVSSQYRKGKIPIAVVGRRIKSLVPYMGFLGEEAYNSLNSVDFPFSGSRLIGFESIDNIQKKFRTLAEKLEQPLFVPKSLRAFTATNIRDFRMNTEIAKIIIGHKIRDIEKFYVSFDIDVLSEAYQRVYPSSRVL